MGVLGSVADAIQAPEDALRLLLSILAGYPLAAVHRTLLYKQSADVQHAFFVATGILIYLFNCGSAIYHSLFSTVIAWLICSQLASKGHKYTIPAAHAAFLGHLLIGYWFAETDTYDITWTTPFCIMTLRYIGLVMDVYDGHQKKETLSGDALKNNIKDVPSLLEIAAFGFCFTGTLVGPQFPLSRFRSFINGEFLDENRDVRKSSILVSVGRFLGGVAYMAIHQWGALWIPSTFFNSDEYLNLSLFWRWTWATLWFRLTMYRYCACWLMTEGAAVLLGLGYNGKDDKGEDKWNGVRDLHVWGWELGHDYNSVVASFNVGTNTFAKNHLFKRLRFLGNKTISHSATLFYLAIWHGYHLGYFVLFAAELACVMAQEQLYSLIDRVPAWKSAISQPIARPFIWLFGKAMISYSMGAIFLTFGLIKTRYWWTPVKSLYFLVYIFYFIVWPIMFKLALGALPRKEKEKAAESVKEAKKEL